MKKLHVKMNDIVDLPFAKTPVYKEINKWIKKCSINDNKYLYCTICNKYLPKKLTYITPKGRSKSFAKTMLNMQYSDKVKRKYNMQDLLYTEPPTHAWIEKCSLNSNKYLYDKLTEMIATGTAYIDLSEIAKYNTK